MPLLLRSLDLPDHEIRANVIDILQAVADPSSKENSAITEHASSIVNNMLRNCLVDKMPSVVSKFITLAAMKPSSLKLRSGSESLPCGTWVPYQAS